MIKVSKKLEKRLRVVVAALMMFPLWVFYSALADSKQNVRPVELGQGWYWDRPPAPTAPLTTTPTVDENFNFVGDSLGDNLKNNFAHNHLYVGWDAADETDKREMISGINFDLDEAGVPFGASITKFEVVILEHDIGSSAHPSDPRSDGGGNHGTLNTAEGRNQGIAACAWPEFLAGDAAKPMSTAPRGGGDCNKKVDGTFTTNTATAATAQSYTWKFDVTGIMSDLWRQNLFTSISLEPNNAPEKRSSSSWIITYHNGAYSEPLSDPVPKPGVTATVEWTPPPDEDIDGDFFNDNNGGSSSDEETTTQSDVFGEFGGFGDSGSSSDTGADVSGSGSPPPVASGTARRLIAGASEGPSADFWDIAFWAWAAALLLLGVLMFSGLLISSDAVPSARPGGAVGALMERFSIRRET